MSQERTEMQRKSRQETQAAKLTLMEFSTTSKFQDLSEDVQAAIKRLCNRVAKPKVSFRDTLINLFGTDVDYELSELDVFKETKMGRSEMMRKTMQHLQSVEPEDRLWVELDTDTEMWVLKGVGVDAPEDWGRKVPE